MIKCMIPSIIKYYFLYLTMKITCVMIYSIYFEEKYVFIIFIPTIIGGIFITYIYSEIAEEYWKKYKK